MDLVPAGRPPSVRFLCEWAAALILSRRSRLKAARRAARMGAGAAGGPPPGMPDDIIEVDLGDGRMMTGTADFMREFMVPAAARLEVDRANATAENQKTEAPCSACGRLMPAAERCVACRQNGVWFCASCHARLEGLTGVGAVA